MVLLNHKTNKLEFCGMNMKDLSFIKMVPITKEEIVLFNSNHVSTEDALITIRGDVYSPNVLCIPKTQWIELFCDGVNEM